MVDDIPEFTNGFLHTGNRGLSIGFTIPEMVSASFFRVSKGATEIFVVDKLSSSLMIPLISFTTTFISTLDTIEASTVEGIFEGHLTDLVSHLPRER